MKPLHLLLAFAMLVSARSNITGTMIASIERCGDERDQISIIHSGQNAILAQTSEKKIILYGHDKGKSEGSSFQCSVYRFHTVPASKREEILSDIRSRINSDYTIAWYD